MYKSEEEECQGWLGHAAYAWRYGVVVTLAYMSAKPHIYRQAVQYGRLLSDTTTLFAAQIDMVSKSISVSVCVN